MIFELSDRFAFVIIWTRKRVIDIMLLLEDPKEKETIHIGKRLITSREFCFLLKGRRIHLPLFV